MILGIETSGKTCSVAVSKDDNILGEFFINNGLTHSETLMPMIDTCLKTLNIDISEIKKIALSVGPGSFTGLRIGASIAIALSQALKIKIIEVSTLEVLAYNLINSNKLVVPIMDARRGQVYTAGFKNGIKIIEEQNILFEELLEQIKQTEEEAIFLGDGTNLYGVVKPSKNLILGRASSVCLLASEIYKKTEKNYNEIEINYLRKPQAEREYNEKNN